VTQVRGFERFSEGRPFYEMPSLMARICGICPVSHLIASARACEAIMSVRIPYTAAQLRRMLNLAQMVQSHALSFFYLSSPDLLLGMESDPKMRNIFGVVGAKPELGRAGIALRRFGQHIIELLGNKRIHPGWVVPGGVTEPLAPAKRDEILAMLPEAYANIALALAAYKQIADRFKPEIEVFGNFPSNYMSLINEDESIEFTVGALRLIDAKGDIIEDGILADHFPEVIGEAVEPYSYTKFAYYKPLGYPQGSYRVGPLARLNIVKSMGTPLADVELAEFKQLASGPVASSFHYHHARLIEVLYGIEKIEQILADPNILDSHVRATAGVNRLEGMGQAEAPRGTLHHHYKVDEDGKITWANLVIATGQNNNAMNEGVLQAAKHYIKDGKFTEGILALSLLSADGMLVDQVIR
jgi:NAD-reducing hydrogenase large subunit